MDEEKKSGSELFPKIQRDISNFLFDEEGNILRSKILTVGSMMVLLSVFLAQDAFAKHTSHSSHKSHSSHSSHSSGSHSSSHSSHVSHQSHSSHASSTHSSNHSSHISSTHIVTPDGGTSTNPSTPSGSSGTASSAATPGTTTTPSSPGTGTTPNSSTATGSPSTTVPIVDSLPAAMEIAPPQIPQPNQVPSVLPNLTSAIPLAPDAGVTPDF